MRLFKTVDEKLLDIGFEKVSEDEHGCEYQRKNIAHNYVHEVVIMRKASGKHILQSYDPELTDQNKIGNTCVGLTAHEMKLFLKKFKELKRNFRRV